MLYLENVHKTYSKINGGKIEVIRDVTLSVGEHEFIAILGPSGCGKSTILRLIAGLETIDSGKIHIDKKLMNNVMPQHREIAMISQNYALYPHMTAYENIAFGLKFRKKTREEIKNEVHKVASMLDISHLLDCKPRQLSGGQRQQVALGRAIALKPKIFLMDEPLSNLDPQLKIKMTAEIENLYRQFNTTFIYVTHDQAEAMSIGTKVAVLRNGMIEQFSSPMELYNNPKNVFVAKFIGNMNLMDAKVQMQSGCLYLLFENNKVLLPRYQYDQDKVWSQKDVIIGIRPEDIRCCNENLATRQLALNAKIQSVKFTGTNMFLNVKSAKNELNACMQPRAQVCKGDDIKLNIDMDKVYLFQKETQKLLM